MVNYDFSDIKDSTLYDRFLPLAKGFISLKYQITVHGEENIPKKGAFILAANHISALDPVMLITHCPRTLHFMAKDELFKKRIFALFLKSMNAFPVKRHTSDKRALEFAKQLVSGGRVLGIFPEGSRTKDSEPKKAKNGVSYLAAKTQADVLPVSIYKTPHEKKPRPHITIRFGKLIKNSEFGFSDDYSQKKIRESSEKIMNAITELWSLKHGEEQ